MIVKMKFLQISGPASDIDRMCDEYLSRHEMQLENAIAELKTTENLQPFIEMNPYRDPLAKAEAVCGHIGQGNVTADTSMETGEMVSFVDEIYNEYMTLQREREELGAASGEMKERLNTLEHFRTLDVKLDLTGEYRFLKLRFGRMSLGYYQRLQRYLADDLKAVFFESSRSEHNVYGGYVAANKDKARVDAVFNSLHFEEIALNENFVGTPEEAYQELWRERSEVKEKLRKLDARLDGLVTENAAKLKGAEIKLRQRSNNFDIRKKAAKAAGDWEGEDSYILCGWMGEEDAEKFLQETKKDEKVMVMVEDDPDAHFQEAPTRLKNPRFFKPFEMFVEMYGLPASNEMDPTIFVALTYTFIFGVMFGDLGQGAVLFLGGQYLYRKKKMALAGIISVAGIFSMLFGILFGSIFGFEDVIPALWLRPKEAVSTLPLVGQLNTIFIVAVAFGMALNLLVMVFQIINARKAHDTENLLFSNNGIAGMVFYGFLVLTIVLFMTGHKAPGNILLAVFLGIPVLMFLFKEPLGNLVEKRHEKMEQSKGMFIVQGLFELIEILLSYFSNTISYVRIGAFAVSHAAMMGVVLMLSGAESGHINWIGIIFGNLFVMLLEGLVVGIQVLRLEYYEMFSRYYKGSGRKFTPFNQTDTV